jgi:hypothetical protein
MPIAGSYSWKERVDTLRVAIPTKGVASSKFDIQVSATTLKVFIHFTLLNHFYMIYLIDVTLPRFIHVVSKLGQLLSLSSGHRFEAFR